MPSIFDEAARSSNSSKPKPPRKAGPPPPSNPFGLTAFKAEEKNLDEFNPEKMTLSDVSRLAAKVRFLHDEIDKKLDYIYQKSGWSPKEIKTYLDNPNNFSPEEWKKIQSQRQMYFNSLQVGQEEEVKELAPDLQTESGKTNKDRRHKMMGARRNWISMR